MKVRNVFLLIVIFSSSYSQNLIYYCLPLKFYSSRFGLHAFFSTFSFLSRYLGTLASLVIPLVVAASVFLPLPPAPQIQEAIVVAKSFDLPCN